MSAEAISLAQPDCYIGTQHVVDAGIFIKRKPKLNAGANISQPDGNRGNKLVQSSFAKIKIAFRGDQQTGYAGREAELLRVIAQLSSIFEQQLDTVFYPVVCIC